MAPEGRSRKRALVKLLILLLSAILVWLGADQYGLIRLLVRVICPSCVGIG